MFKKLQEFLFGKPAAEAEDLSAQAPYKVEPLVQAKLGAKAAAPKKSAARKPSRTPAPKKPRARKPAKTGHN
jgi:hypothetical protein